MYLYEEKGISYVNELIIRLRNDPEKLKKLLEQISNKVIIYLI